MGCGVGELKKGLSNRWRIGIEVKAERLLKGGGGLYLNPVRCICVY